MTPPTLEELLRAADVTHVHVNGPGRVYAVRGGRTEAVGIRFRDAAHVLEVVRSLMPPDERAALGWLHGGEYELPDGTRVDVVLGPAAPDGPAVTFRCHRPRATPLRELLAERALAPEMALFLETAVRAKLNVLLSCGNGADGQPLLEALSAFVQTNEPLVVLTDAGRWPLSHPVVTWLGLPAAHRTDSRRHLFRQAVSMRPGRVLVTSGGAAELLHALQAATGSVCWITRIDAAGPRDAQFQIEVAALTAATPTPLSNVRKQLAGSLHVVAQFDRLANGETRVTRIDEVVGAEADVLYHTLFRYREHGAAGRFEATGVRPTFLDRLRSRGLRFPVNLFRERTLAAG